VLARSSSPEGSLNDPTSVVPANSREDRFPLQARGPDFLAVTFDGLERWPRPIGILHRTSQARQLLSCTVDAGMLGPRPVSFGLSSPRARRGETPERAPPPGYLPRLRLALKRPNSTASRRELSHAPVDIYFRCGAHVAMSILLNCSPPAPFVEFARQPRSLLEACCVESSPPLPSRTTARADLLPRGGSPAPVVAKCPCAHAGRARYATLYACAPALEAVPDSALLASCADLVRASGRRTFIDRLWFNQR
jgi:hypothetical protein